MLQCVAVCCSMLRHKSVCCSVLQCVAVCCSVLQFAIARKNASAKLQLESVCCSLLLQPIAFRVSFNIVLNVPTQSPWSFFNGTWQKRPGELESRLRFEIEEMTLQMQKAVR